MSGRISAARRHLTFANVMSVIAVFIALGGASYAAINLPKDSVGTKQLKKKSVGTKQLKANAVNSNKVKNFSLGQTTSRKGRSRRARPDLRESRVPPAPQPGLPAAIWPAKYPNPVIADGAVDSDKVLNDSLGGADILESDLGQVPDAGSVDGLDGADLLRSAIYAVEQSVSLPGGFNTALSPNCEAGDLAIAGGWDVSQDITGNIHVRAFKRIGTDEWLVNLSNLGASAQDITAYVLWHRSGLVVSTSESVACTSRGVRTVCLGRSGAARAACSIPFSG